MEGKMIKEKLVIQGTKREVQETIRRIGYDYKRLNHLSDNTYDDLRVVVLECTPYSPEEVEERMVYGDWEHEEYLLSDSYEADCKSEKWDWLKNEH